MQAVVRSQYGGPQVLRIEEVEKPILEEDQVLVKVHASSINAKDYRLMRANPFFIRLMDGGLLKPKNPRLGSDLAGVVEAAGEKVTQFKPGHEVFGCRDGAFAEYVGVREGGLALKPAGIPFEQVAVLPVAGLTALQGLRAAGEIRPGQKVLIQGASGGVGTFAVQIAKAWGAEVTAVCSRRNLEMARSIGADHVIDYTREDFTRNGQQYDIIFAVNGYHPLSHYKRALSFQGVYVCVGGKMRQLFESMLLGPRMFREGEKKIGSLGMAKVVQEDLVTLGRMLEAGKIHPVIDRCYPLSEIADAMRYVEDTHAQGKVSITMD